MPQARIVLIVVLCIAFGISTTLAQQVNDEDVCTICQDGSPISIPDGVIELDGVEWTCSELSQILWLLGADAGGGCESLHFRGFVNCGCPTFDNDEYCSMCPKGFSDLPDPDIAIPGFEDLTCKDIIFAQRSDPEAPIPCEELENYAKLCHCPESCSFCRYSDESLANLDRIIPYLTHGDNQVTCAEHAAAVGSLLRGEDCDMLREPPVPVNVEGYCGCPRSSAANLCPLCPDGVPLRNPDLVTANVGGLTCQELEEYLMYVNDPEVCTSISETSQECCGYLDACPVCPDGSWGRGSGQVYEPYGLGCDQIGQSTDFGFPLTCEEAQDRFPFFCGCEGVLAECTICRLNQVPPDPSRFIPMLNITCGEANDLASIASSIECSDTLLDFRIDVAGFCGCGEDTSLYGRCAFCPEGQELAHNSDFADTVIVGRSAHDNIFGDLKVTYDPTLEQHCNEIEALAPWVIEGEMCKAVQQSIPACCRPISTLAPTTSAPPTTRPTTTPSLAFTNATNVTDWDKNLTDWVGMTNGTGATPTRAPVYVPPPTIPTLPVAVPRDSEDSSASIRGRNHALGFALASALYGMAS